MNESFVRPVAPDAAWKTTNFFTYGLANNTELAVTTFGAGLPKTDNLTMAFGFKRVFPILKERSPGTGLKLTAGYMLPVSLQGKGVGNYAYSHLSGRLPRLRTRITAGINTGTAQVFGRDVLCFIGGIEHPLTPQLTAIAEYYSGTHDFAGAVVGLVHHNHRNDLVLVGGLRIPNNSRSGNMGLVFEIGKFFGKKPRHSMGPIRKPNLGIVPALINTLYN